MFLFGLLIALFALILLLLTSIFLGVFQSAEEKKRLNELNKIPGPKSLPFLGSLVSMPPVQQEMLSWLVAQSKRYEGMFLMKFGTLWVVFVGKNEWAAEILRGSKHSEKSQFYRSTHEWLGLGLLNSGGSLWKSRRRLITPAFHFDILDKTLETMIKHTSVAIQKFEAFAERGEYVDVWEEISLLTLDIISDSAMGVELEAQLRNPVSLEYVANRDKVSMHTVNRFRTLWLFGDFIYYNFTPAGRDERQRIKTMHKFTENVILQRWEDLQDNFEEFQLRRKKTFLDLLLLSRNDYNLSFEDIRNEVDTFMFEGHDTTTAAMSFVLQLLASNSAVMRRLQKEVDEKFDSINFSPDNWEAIKKAIGTMSYLDAVLKEALRVFPSVPAISREMNENVELNGYKIPKGSDVMVHIYAIHHDESVFPEPNSFKPDRWLNKEIPLDEKPFCFVPFSAGPRNCIGQRFALMEEKLIIATIARNFDIISDTPMDKLQIYGQLVLRPHEKFHIKFSKRV